VPDVRFGSKADICSAKGHVRFTPNSDIDCVLIVLSRSVVPLLPNLNRLQAELPASNVQQSSKRLDRVSDMPSGPQNYDIADAIIELPLGGNLFAVRGLPTCITAKGCGASTLSTGLVR
jgi:hypothetical protein